MEKLYNWIKHWTTRVCYYYFIEKSMYRMIDIYLTVILNDVLYIKKKKKEKLEGKVCS